MPPQVIHDLLIGCRGVVLLEHGPSGLRIQCCGRSLCCRP
jgi:hypothetical protein